MPFPMQEPPGKELDPDHGISPAWSELADDVWTYENARVERWRNEINILLVFVSDDLGT